VRRSGHLPVRSEGSHKPTEQRGDYYVPRSKGLSKAQGVEGTAGGLLAGADPKVPRRREGPPLRPAEGGPESEGSDVGPPSTLKDQYGIVRDSDGPVTV
jgi:hypothetical protein